MSALHLERLARPPPRRTLSVVVSLAVLVLAPLSWWWSIDDPVLRSTGLSAWMLLATALFLAFSAARHDARRWVRGVFVLELGVLGLFAWAFFDLARLPATDLPERAVNFTLPDQDGRAVTLSSELEKGPVLLVFYRGHW